MLPYYEIQHDDVTIYHVEKPLNFPAHFHNHLEIVYVYSGMQTIEIDGSAYLVSEGEAVLIFPDIVHRYSVNTDHTANFLLIIVEPRVLGGNFSHMSNFQPVIPVIPKQNIHEDAVFALSRIKKRDKLVVQLGWIYIILSHLLQCIELDHRKRTPVPDMCKKLIDYMAEHFTEPMTLDTLASEFCVSKFYISRIFSEKIKMNFNQYLSSLRAEYASRLIRTTNDSLTDICYNAGFGSQRTFNRVFHSVYGLSPKEYRNQSQIS